MTDRHRQEHQGQSSKNYRLDQSHQQLQTVDEVGNHQGHQKGDHYYQDFARRHVPKKSESEADHPDQLTDELQEPYEHVDKSLEDAPTKDTAKGEKFLQISEPVGFESPVLHKEEGDQRQRQGHVQVGTSGTQEVCLDQVFLAADKAHKLIEGEQRQPGVKQHKEEDGGNYWKGLAGHVWAQYPTGETDNAEFGDPQGSSVGFFLTRSGGFIFTGAVALFFSTSLTLTGMGLVSETQVLVTRGSGKNGLGR